MSDDREFDLVDIDRCVGQLRNAAVSYVEACRVLVKAVKAIPEDVQCRVMRAGFTGLCKSVSLSGELMMVMGKDMTDHLNRIAVHLNAAHLPKDDDSDLDVPDPVVH